MYIANCITCTHIASIASRSLALSLSTFHSIPPSRSYSRFITLSFSFEYLSRSDFSHRPSYIILHFRCYTSSRVRLPVRLLSLLLIFSRLESTPVHLRSSERRMNLHLPKTYILCAFDIIYNNVLHACLAMYSIIYLFDFLHHFD